MKNSAKLAIGIALCCALLPPTYTFASTVAASQVATIQTAFNSKLLPTFPNQAQLAIPSIVEFKVEDKTNDVLTYLTTKPTMDVKMVGLVLVCGFAVIRTRRRKLKLSFVKNM
nr:hypothetical protein [uncultured Tolumonas sp.]